MVTLGQTRNLKTNASNTSDQKLLKTRATEWKHKRRAGSSSIHIIDHNMRVPHPAIAVCIGHRWIFVPTSELHVLREHARPLIHARVSVAPTAAGTTPAQHAIADFPQ